MWTHRLRNPFICPIKILFQASGITLSQHRAVISSYREFGKGLQGQQGREVIKMYATGEGQGQQKLTGVYKSYP